MCDFFVLFVADVSTYLLPFGWSSVPPVVEQIMKSWRVLIRGWYDIPTSDCFHMLFWFIQFCITLQQKSFLFDTDLLFTWSLSRCVSYLHLGTCSITCGCRYSFPHPQSPCRVVKWLHFIFLVVKSRGKGCPRRVVVAGSYCRRYRPSYHRGAF